MANFLCQLEKEIKRLSKERDQLSKRIRSLEAVKNEYSKSELQENNRPRSELVSQGRAQKIAEVLREAGKPLHYKEIADRLSQIEEFGKVKDMGAVVTATFSHYRDVFKRVGKGTYTLIEPEETQTKKQEDFS